MYCWQAGPQVQDATTQGCRPTDATLPPEDAQPAADAPLPAGPPLMADMNRDDRNPAALPEPAQRHTAASSSRSAVLLGARSDQPGKGAAQSGGTQRAQEQPMEIAEPSELVSLVYCMLQPAKHRQSIECCTQLFLGEQ